MNSALRNQQAMASAQAAYDNALPVDDLDFLDCAEGEEWQKDAAEELAGGNETHHTLDGVPVFQCDLIQKLLASEEGQEKMEWLLSCLLDDLITGGDDNANRRDVCETDIKKWALEEAEKMVAPYANAHVEARMEP